MIHYDEASSTDTDNSKHDIMSQRNIVRFRYTMCACLSFQSNILTYFSKYMYLKLSMTGETLNLTHWFFSNSVRMSSRNYGMSWKTHSIIQADNVGVLSDAFVHSDWRTTTSTFPQELCRQLMIAWPMLNKKQFWSSCIVTRLSTTPAVCYPLSSAPNVTTFC